MLDFTDIKFFKLAVGQDRIGHETEIDINAKCPICGDSTDNFLNNTFVLSFCDSL